MRAFVTRGEVLASLVFRGRWVRWVIRIVVLAASIAAPSTAAALAWTVERVQAPRPAELRSVSCSSATACTAVGDQGNSVLVERWNGRRWSIQATPRIPGMFFSGVSCPAARVCIAVGSEGSSSLVERVERGEVVGAANTRERWNLRRPARSIGRVVQRADRMHRGWHARLRAR